MLWRRERWVCWYESIGGCRSRELRDSSLVITIPLLTYRTGAYKRAKTIFSAVQNHSHSRLRTKQSVPCRAEGEIEREGRVIKDVFCPHYVTKELYDVCRCGSVPQLRTSSSLPHSKEGGFSILFSITPISPLASSTVYYNLHIAKGPSIGAEFTLACPYTILGHPFELVWTESLGVERGIVRLVGWRTVRCS